MPWQNLVGGWYIDRWVYLVLVAVLTIAIRGLVSLVRVIKPRGKPTWPSSWPRRCWNWLKRWQSWLQRWPNWLRHWWDWFWPSPAFDLDPMIIGTLELLAYPVLMKAQAWTAIGAWLGFKTVAKWDAWTRGRAEYNLFLIGNALVLIASLLFLTPYVHLKPPPACDFSASRAELILADAPG